jgi:hypothetical protein
MFSGRVRQRPIVVEMQDAAEGLARTEHADSLGVQSFVPVPPQLESLGASSSLHGRSSGSDHILQKAGFCTHTADKEASAKTAGAAVFARTAG